MRKRVFLFVLFCAHLGAASTGLCATAVRPGYPVPTYDKVVKLDFRLGLGYYSDCQYFLAPQTLPVSAETRKNNPDLQLAIHVLSKNYDADEALEKLIADGQVQAIGHLLGFSSLQIQAKHIHQAIRTQNIDTLELLLKLGGDVNARTKDSLTPLMAAAHIGFAKGVQVLLNEGARVNDVDAINDTALLFAVDKNHSAIVQILLQHGAHHDIEDQFGFTALHLAAHRGYPRSARLLVEQGVDVDVRNEYGETPLMEAAKFRNSSKIIDMLILLGADINAVNKDGSTPLLITSVLGHVSTARRLIALGADINTRDTDQGLTPLMIAAALGNKNMVKLLIQKGAQLEARDRNQQTALMLAMQGGSIEVTRQLIKAGASLEARDDDGQNAIDQLLEQNNSLHQRLEVEINRARTFEKFIDSKFDESLIIIQK